MGGEELESLPKGLGQCGADLGYKQEMIGIGIHRGWIEVHISTDSIYI